MISKKKLGRIFLRGSALSILLVNPIVNVTHLSSEIVISIKAEAETYYGYAPEEDCRVASGGSAQATSKTDTNTATDTSSKGAADTDWTQPGTTAYKNLKETWDFWVSQGMSGTQVAGVAGNIGGAENTSFTLDLMEYGGGGGGYLYQFTPHTKYSSWEGYDKSNSATNQGQFVIASEGDTVIRYIEATQGEDTAKAAENWANMYERPAAWALAASLKSRQDAAKKIYDMFDGGKIKQDNSKIASWAGGDVKGDSSNKEGSKTKSGSKDNSGGYTTSNDCKPKCDIDSKSSKDVKTNTNTDSSTSSAGASSLADKIDAFVKEHKEAYLQSWKAGGFLPSASIVQSIIEIGFNEDVPSFGQAHNMGGVKFATKADYPYTTKLYGDDAVSDSGPGTNVGDGTGGSYAYFKSYDAGIVGKSEFMAHQNLYTKAINNTDGKATLDAIADGGWATDPSYKTKLNEMYDTYGTRYKWLDEEAISKYGEKPYEASNSTDNVAKASETKAVSCEEPGAVIGGDGWQKTGGTVNYHSDMFWKRGDLPDDLKPYALNPESIGMAFGSRTGWDGASAYLSSGIFDQCTTFSAACFGALWVKDNKQMGGAHGMSGNGEDLVGQTSATLGTKVSTTPTSGDVFSYPNNHTGIVSHVFDNGDILVVEQNVIGYSGGGIGESFTWSYSYITKGTQTARSWTFTNPSSVGYNVNPSAKALA